ncbi:MAG: tRNA preQ1(34) S-adenosylmethionine ribosyltransferase-isomerase QueA [Geminicoccaceae bacterium]
MRVDRFAFDLPEELIAQYPAEPRESARLLHVGVVLDDLRVADLPDLFEPGEVLVLNDTRVLPTRFLARRGEVLVEVTLVEASGDDRWWAFARPGRKLRVGDDIRLADSLGAHVEEKREDGRILLRLGESGEALVARIKAHGHMPLPPYIRRPRGGSHEDDDRYQTVFARRDGAVAAPTASLHLTRDLLRKLEDRGVKPVTLTLHVGMGTFLPVKTGDTDDHVMHAEWFEIGDDTASVVNAARAAGHRVTAAGTTALRALESAFHDGAIRAMSGHTDIFITPGVEIRSADRLLTNFHLPCSTLLMLVSAFAGMERMRAAYRHAVAKRYRFFSYGDASLLERAR